jgi:hypothetical protein
MADTIISLDKEVIPLTNRKYVEGLNVDTALFGVPNFAMTAKDNAFAVVAADVFKRLAYTNPAQLSSASSFKKNDVEIDAWKQFCRTKENIVEYQLQSLQLGLLTDAVLRVNMYSVSFHWIQHARHVLIEGGDSGGVWSDTPP